MSTFGDDRCLARVIASATTVNGNTVFTLSPGNSFTVLGRTGDAAQWFG